VPDDSDSLAGLRERLERLESESAIRALVSTYFELCDRLDDPESPAAIGALFTEDAQWGGAGARYGAAFGTHEGRAAIVAMLARYQGPPPHFTFNAHFLGSERITVDGDAARGYWLMLQTSSYATGTSDLRAARLDLTFGRSAAGWRIRRFETTNLFSRPVDRWDDPAPIPLPDN
jgi:hypothetical protein